MSKPKKNKIAFFKCEGFPHVAWGLVVKHENAIIKIAGCDNWITPLIIVPESDGTRLLIEQINNLKGERSYALSTLELGFKARLHDIASWIK